MRLDINASKELKIFSIVGGELANIEPDISPSTPIETETAHFIRCMKEGKQPEIVRLEDCVRMMEIIDSFYRSAERGEEIRLA